MSIFAEFHNTRIWHGMVLNNNNKKKAKELQGKCMSDGRNLRNTLSVLYRGEKNQYKISLEYNFFCKRN